MSTKPICNSKCHFKTFHLAFEMYIRCPDPTCDYPMIPTIEDHNIDKSEGKYVRARLQ